MHFVYVKIPVGTQADTALREQGFHEGLELALTAQGLGSVLGWGASLSARSPDEPSRVAFHRIDIEITEPALALDLLQRTLIALDAPFGAELHYTLDDISWHSAYGPAGWSEAQAVNPTMPRRGSARKTGH